MVWKSNAKGVDTPVLQLRYCHVKLADVYAVELEVRYKSEPVRKVKIPRLEYPKIDVSACTMSSLKDLWSARPWIEHHRNIGIKRFTIYVNDIIPSPQQTLPSSQLEDALIYVLSQNDVNVIEWNYIFKDPNTTRNRVTAPLHYARPMEWNSCNDREHYFSRMTIFNDMDEYIISKMSLDKLLDMFPDYCKGVHVGQYWTRLECPTNSKNASLPAFDRISEMYK